MRNRFRLHELLENVEIDKTVPDISIRGIESDSRKIQPGFLFAAMRGIEHDGHEFIEDAVSKGAVCVISEKEHIDRDNVCFIRVENSKNALIQILRGAYKDIFNKITCIGITGTNGKTTVSYLVKSILNHITPHKAGLIGTIGYDTGKGFQKASHTTPDEVTLVKIINQMRQNNISDVILEVSSHAVAQQRIDVLDFRIGCFTNLSQDHLDYHKDMETYFLVKSVFFKKLSPSATGIINIDCAYGKRLLPVLKTKNIITYAVNDKKACLYASDIKSGINGVCFLVHFQGKSYPVKSTLIGLHNVYNLLAAFGICIGLGKSLEDALDAVEHGIYVPGRLERVREAKQYSIFVDYAHTEDGLKNVLNSLRELTPGKLIVVFGCGGDRDKDKRSKMGRTASAIADFCVITSDNPRTEDANEIISEIEKGMLNKNYCIEPDRKKAIEKAMAYAEINDTILIAGKGHEDYQIIGDKKIHFDDREVVKTIIEEDVRSWI